MCIRGKLCLKHCGKLRNLCLAFGLMRQVDVLEVVVRLVPNTRVIGVVIEFLCDQS